MNENLQEMIKHLQINPVSVQISSAIQLEDCKQVIQVTQTNQIQIKTTNSCIILYDGAITPSNIICQLNYACILNIDTTIIQSGNDILYIYYINYSITSTIDILYTLRILVTN